MHTLLRQVALEENPPSPWLADDRTGQIWSGVAAMGPVPNDVDDEQGGVVECTTCVVCGKCDTTQVRGMLYVLRGAVVMLA